MPWVGWAADGLPKENPPGMPLTQIFEENGWVCLPVSNSEHKTHFLFLEMRGGASQAPIEREKDLRVGAGELNPAPCVVVQSFHSRRLREPTPGDPFLWSLVRFLWADTCSARVRPQATGERVVKQITTESGNQRSGVDQLGHARHISM